MSSIILKFGNKEFTIRPLTCGQLKEIGVGAAKQRKNHREQSDTPEGEAEFYDSSMEILKAALSKDYPDEKVEELEMTFPILHSSLMEILKLSGLVSSGELEAAPLNGDGSTVV